MIANHVKWSQFQYYNKYCWALLVRTRLCGRNYAHKSVEEKEDLLKGKFISIFPCCCFHGIADLLQPPKGKTTTQKHKRRIFFTGRSCFISILRSASLVNARMMGGWMIGTSAMNFGMSSGSSSFCINSLPIL